MLSAPTLVPILSEEVKLTEPHNELPCVRTCGVIYESEAGLEKDANPIRTTKTLPEVNCSDSDLKSNKVNKEVHKPIVNFDKVEVSKISHSLDSESELNETDKQSTTNSNKVKEKLCKPLWSRKCSSIEAGSITSNFKASTSSLSTLSSVPSDSKYCTDPNATSPELHLAKLKRIHTKVKRRKQWRRISKILYFLIFRILINFILLTSFVFLLCGYLLNIRSLLIVGCILSLASAGCLVQLCFTKRSTPNKFNPSSVPFALAPEDLPNAINLTSDIQTNPTHPRVTLSPPENPPNSPQYSAATSLSETGQSTTKPLNTPIVIGMDQIQARRISMALARVASGQLQTPRYHPNESSGVLNMARRLTMASSAMGMGHSDHMGMESTWLTGSRIRHGVRRSLAWNESGATRFYEHNYD